MTARRPVPSLCARALFGALLVIVLVPGVAAAGGPGSARPGGGPDRLSGRFATVSDAVTAGVVDAQVARDLAARGRVDALVTFDDAEILARALALAPKANGRSEAVLRVAKPAFARQKNAALGFAGAGAKLLRDYGNLATVFVRFSSPHALLGAASAPGVSGVRQNRTYKAQLAQSLPLINQPAAAAAGYKGAGVTVAVLDTGLDYAGHADPSFGDCSGGPALVGPCRVAWRSDIAPDDGMLDDSDPSEGFHGTNVAGIVLGVAPEAKVISLDVFTGSGAGAGATTDDLNKAVDWLVARQSAYKIRAVNLSLGDDSHMTDTCWDSPMAPGFASARAVGILPVVASGNYAKEFGYFQDGIAYPACTPGAVSIGAVYDGDIAYDLGCGDGATTEADQITCFSQTAPIQTILAPGAFITAAGLTFAGTSQATPHVAGAAAVLAAAKPSATPYQVQRLLTDNGAPVVDVRTGLTKHRLDLFAAVTAASAGLPPQPMWAEAYLAVGPQDRWSFGSSLARTSNYLHNVHMSWSASPSPLMQVEYIRSADGGASWKGIAGATPTRLNYSTQHASYGAVATAGNYVYAAWTMLASAGATYVASQPRTIQFKASSDQGAHWPSSVKSLTYTKNSAGQTLRVDQPGIAAYGSRVYVVWTDSNTGAIRVATSSNNGNSFTTKSIGSTSVTLADGSGRWGMPVVATYGSNVAVVWLASWSSTGRYGALKASVSRNGGSTWSTRTLDGDSRDRAAVGASGNRIAVGWVDSGAARLQVWQSGVWQTQRTASSSMFSSSPAAKYKTGYAPAVALYGTSGVSVAWSVCRNAGCYGDSKENGVDLLWRESTNNGAGWKTAQTLIASSQQSAARAGNDAADIEYGSVTKRYIDFQGWTNSNPAPWRIYQRTGVG
jgi:subtilisin family serine protease